MCVQKFWLNEFYKSNFTYQCLVNHFFLKTHTTGSAWTDVHSTLKKKKKRILHFLLTFSAKAPILAMPARTVYENHLPDANMHWSLLQLVSVISQTVCVFHFKKGSSNRMNEALRWGCINDHVQKWGEHDFWPVGGDEKDKEAELLSRGLYLLLNV